MNAENSPRGTLTPSGGAVMQPVVPGKPPAAAAQANMLVGPLKGAAGSRENRDMSEGLEKSRSHKLGALVQMTDLG